MESPAAVEPNWRLSRRWRQHGERRFSPPGGGPVTTDGSNRRRKSTEPPSPLTLIPRLNGDPSRPHDRSNYLRYKGVPRPASFVLSAAVAHSSAVARSSAVAYLFPHTCGRRAQPREGQTSPPAGRARQARPGLDFRGGWLFPDWMTVSGLDETLLAAPSVLPASGPRPTPICGGERAAGSTAESGRIPGGCVRLPVVFGAIRFLSCSGA